MALSFRSTIRTRLRSWLSRRKLRRAVKRGDPLRIIVGAGGTSFSGWISTDMDFLNLLKPEDWERHFQADSIKAILAEHVWEHLTPEDGERAARQCFEYLAPAGYLRIAVPDGFHPDPSYIEHVRVGGSGCGADDHKVLYTIESLANVLNKVGFDVLPLEHHDSEGNFHAKHWNPDEGMVRRSIRFDPRNRDGKPHYTSLIVDARKSGR